MMSGKIIFNARYFLLAVLLFIIEVMIAIYVHDDIIRPYVGDILVVIFLYCLVRAFLNIPVKAAAIGVLIFSYLIETLQYFHIVDLLGLEHSTLARIIIGTYFTWTDIWMYTIGIAIVFATEAMIKPKQG